MRHDEQQPAGTVEGGSWWLHLVVFQVSKVVLSSVVECPPACLDPSGARTGGTPVTVTT